MKEFVSKDSKFKVIVTQAALEQLQNFCINSAAQETGGVLVGKYIDDQITGKITHVSQAPSDSKNGTTWFIRGLKGLQEWVDSFWKSGKGYYLGEWHFHPFNSANPSNQDISEMKRISKNKSVNCPEPILLILGGDPSKDWHLSITIISANRVISLPEIK